MRQRSLHRPSIAANCARGCFRAALLVAALSCAVLRAEAILRVAGEVGRNRAAPTGAYAGSGWQFLGYWGGVLGTPVAPHFFLTAKHAGFAGDGQFHTESGDYTVVNAFSDPGSDLVLYQVAETFSEFAPLYTGSDEVTLGEAVLYGCGTDRGGPVLVDGVQQGWEWGIADFPKSWGTNAVSSIADFGSSLGDLLLFTVDGAGSGFENEGAISAWDSGGPVFVQESGVWKLAGVHYGVENYSLDGQNGFSGAIWDTRGLYVRGNNGYEFVSSSLTAPQPGLFGSTRTSSRHRDFLQPILSADLALATPEPGTLPLLLPLFALGAAGHCRRRRTLL
ncbi:MAG: hypothetical protein H7Z41_11585 [Cytophagales bacterium]|nr:hypothetical protein [Armatimonadota bacterium]